MLFYVYPLKFLFTLAFQTGGIVFQVRDTPALFLIYGLGFASVSFVLGLTEWESLVTRLSVVGHLAIAMIGLVSARGSPRSYRSPPPRRSPASSTSPSRFPGF